MWCMIYAKDSKDAERSMAYFKLRALLGASCSSIYAMLHILRLCLLPKAGVLMEHKEQWRIGFSWFHAVVSLVMSFAVNKSVMWGILHMLIYPFYIPYWVCAHSKLPEMIWESIGK